MFVADIEAVVLFSKRRYGKCAFYCNRVLAGASRYFDSNTEFLEDAERERGSHAKTQRRKEREKKEKKEKRE
jgi:hypothetical protein